MRKFIRDQLLEIFSTILDGVKIAKAKSTTPETAEVILSDCYGSVTSIDATLQSVLSQERHAQYKIAIDNLKAMLEFLFTSIAEKQPTSEISKDIKKQIKLIQNELSEESEVRLEIVFMPYKASMFDSMESIYLAAKNDPSCDAYLVPIPYYSKNPGGSFSNLHYEGNEFAKDMDVIHYDSYDMAKRNPDIIYIHNPYDEYNYVTSVHPKYYSHELKKYTDMLVYVPYFVTNGITSYLFCAASAVTHSNKVIIQSELDKKPYLKFADKSKLLALGSPKLDKLINTNRKDICIPEEWEKIISGKKIVLYNTHLSNVIINNNGFLAHLKNVLSIFENRSDVVLWWRPHPLSQETITSMNPKIITEYNAIVQDYIQKGFGIFDDTTDLHRALLISDAYYGDRSSIVPMYLATKKPVLLQNTSANSNVPANANELKMPAWDFSVEENEIWFVPNNVCALFNMNLTTNEIRLISLLPNQKIFDFDVFTSIKAVGEYLVLVPGKSNEILKYHIPTGKFEETAVKPLYTRKFIGALSHKDNIYMLPNLYSSVVKYNIQNNQVKEIKSLCDKLDDIKARNNFYFYNSSVVNNNLAMLPCANSNSVIEFNLNLDKFAIHSVGHADNCYTCIAFDGNCYWLFTHTGSIIKWNKAKGQIIEISDFPAAFRPGLKYNFIQAEVFGEYVYAFPWQANMILQINIKTNEVKCFANLDKRESINSKLYSRHKYLCAKTVEKSIYAFSQYEGCLQKINPALGEIENIPFTLSDEDYKKIMTQPLFSSWDETIPCPNYIYENPIVSLEFYLDRLASESINTDKIKLDNINSIFLNMDGSCGIKIHEAIKNQLK